MYSEKVNIYVVRPQKHEEEEDYGHFRLDMGARHIDSEIMIFFATDC